MARMPPEVPEENREGVPGAVKGGFGEYAFLDGKRVSHIPPTEPEALIKGSFPGDVFVFFVLLESIVRIF